MSAGVKSTGADSRSADLCSTSTWDEAARLQALDRYAILDTGSEAAFDDVAALAADILDAPIAVVNFIASDRQWFKAEVGIGTDTLPLDVSICRHAILQPGVFVVPDLTKDARFENNPLVNVAEGLRFYAGALLETPDGLPLGTVCVLDTKVRPDGISARQERALKVLASQTMARLELRRSEALARHERMRAEKHARRLSLLAEASSLIFAAPDLETAIHDLLALVTAGFRLDVAFHYRCQPGCLGLATAMGLTSEQEAAAARIEIGQTICGLVAERREAMHVTGIQTSADPHTVFLKRLGLESYFSAPLLGGGDLLGTLSFGRKSEAFSPGELEALGTLVGQLAIAIERRYAEAQLSDSEERQTFLLDLSDRLRPLSATADIVGLAADRLGERMGVNRAFYAEIAGGRMTVERDYARGVPSLIGEHSLQAFGPDLLSAYQAGAVLTVNDVGADARLNEEARAGLRARRVGAFADIVLFQEDRRVGLLAVQSDAPRVWTAAEVGLAREVGERVKTAIERARAEVARRTSEARFRGLFAASPTPFLAVAPDAPRFTITGVNDHYLAATMRTREDLIGLGIFEAFPDNPDDPRADGASNLRASLMRALESRAQDAMPVQKYAIARADGGFEERWWDPCNSPVLNERGEVEAMIHHVTDVTERRRAEEERERLVAAIEQSPDFIGIADRQGRGLYINRGARILCGLPQDVDARDVEIIDFFPPEDRAFVREVVLPAQASEGGYQGELRLRRFDGAEPVPVSYDGFTIRDSHGEVTAFATVTRDVTERKAAEEALRASEARFRAALTIETVGAIYFDMEGRLTDANDAFLAMGGYTRSELEAGDLTWQNLTPPEYMDVSQRAFEELKTRGVTTPYEKEYIRKDGSRWWSLFAAKLLPDGTGFEFVLDITERKQAEQRRLALVELGDRIRDTEDSNHLAYAAAEILGRTLRVSRAGYGTIDTAAETISIKRDWNALGIESLAGVLQFRDYGSYTEDLKRGETVVFANAEIDPRTAATADALKAISAQSVVNMPVTEQGVFVALLYLNHATARAWSDEDLALIRDVAERTRTAVERLRAEAELRELNETLERRVSEALAEKRLLAELVEGTDAFVQVADLQFRWLAINKAAADEYERIFGVRPKVGDSMLDLLADKPEQQAAVRAVWSRALAGEEFTQVDEFGEPSLDRRCYEMKYNVLRDARGRRIGAYQFVYDVTQRVEEQRRLAEAEEALRQSQKMEAMGSLTGGVAHDFNNLLTPIIGGLDLLQRKGLGGEREQRLIAGAAQSAERAKTLVQRLLAFARRQPLQPVSVDLAHLVEGMVDLVASTSGPRVKVEVDTSPDLPPVKADPNQLEMAILNLAVNARDATPDGGRLTVAATSEAITAGHRSGLAPGRYVRLVVADTGTGMDPATLKRATEPFFSTKGVGKGTGLGLSMVHGLAAQPGGALTIQSKRGVGTSVELWLPVATEETRPDEPPTEHAALAAVGTALLVDDEQLVRASTADMLSDLGYAVVEADSAEEALRLVDGGLAPDVVVTDHLMPGMSGTDLVLALKDRRVGANVLIVSGYAEDEGVSADLHRLTKPFVQAELAGKLAALGEREFS